ncbi:MAG: nucleotidyltransferase domain-containing protein [Candidatus Nanopelagicales bacterium]
MDLVALARRIVDERFPGARAAVLAGSAGEGRATAYSDLDVVVVLDGPPAPYRETIRVEGWPVELFVHTDDSIAHWFGVEREQGLCTLAHMLATGKPLAGPDVATVQQHSRDHVDAGPEPWDAARVDYRRYLISDALDDLAGARDDDERDAVAGQLLTMTAELHLAVHGRWLGKGKWLLRRLRDLDRDLADNLYAAHRAAVATGKTAALVATCDEVLAPLGGRLTEGFAVR